MTLLIAAKVGNEVWMIADTAITGGELGLRAREFTKKIEMPTSRSLVGFVGDVHIGQRTLRQVAKLDVGNAVLEKLRSVSASASSVEFAYAYDDEGQRRLFKIVAGLSEELPTLHLGNHEAFEQFQRARNSKEIEHAPSAVHQLILASSGTPPDGLSNAVKALLGVFADREDHDVGGWPTPFVLNADGASLCPYVYSVTDPVVNELKTGDLVPQGTAEAGGFGFSFTSFAGGAGMAVYWLQKQSGLVYFPAKDGYEKHQFTGLPSEFSDSAAAALGERPHVWFSNGPVTRADEISILRDQQGNHRMAVGRQGSTLSVGWIQGPSDSFWTRATIDMRDESIAKEGGPTRFSVKASVDSKGASVNDSSSGCAFTVNTSELDDLILQLADLRAGLSPPVEAKLENISFVATIDPAWQTFPSPHPTAVGAILALRHIGVGWVGFILPAHEQISLGRWLTQNGEASKSR